MMSLSEMKQIVTWLGYEADQCVSLHDTLPLFDQPNLDVMVLRKVRESLEKDYTQRRQFNTTLGNLLTKKTNQGATWLDALTMAYEPGMYVEAARFLWEKS